MEYTYDHAGRMKTLKTWRNFASDTGAALTTWNYSAARGFLLSKQYADSQGPAYTYTAAGRLATRTWARGLTTYYAYNNAGDLASVNYDDNLTPGVTHADASYWIYQYDTLDQVTSGKHFWADGTPVAGQQFEYGFDDIGNRQSATLVGQASSLPVRAASVPPVPAPHVRRGRLGTRGTDAPPTGRQGCLPHTGCSNLRVETYTANDLNQYTQRTVPGFAEVQGRARSDATVTVNLQATLRQGPYWRSELMTDNSASPVWLGITNVAVPRPCKRPARCLQTPHHLNPQPQDPPWLQLSHRTGPRHHRHRTTRG